MNQRPNVPGVSEWLSIEALGDRVDHYRSIEWALCSALGAWSADDDDPAAQRQFAEASARHAWHLEMWDERRPQLNTVAPAPPPAAWEGANELVAAKTTADRHAAAARVVDELGAAYRTQQMSTDATVDPATAEILRRILA